MRARDEQVGKAVTVFRGERSQKSVADAMRERGWKWSQATVWSVEKGERPLRLTEAADLAVVLGLMSGNDFMRGPTMAQIQQLNFEASQRYTAINEATQRYVETRIALSRTVEKALSECTAVPGHVLLPTETWLGEDHAPEEAVLDGYSSIVGWYDEITGEAHDPADADRRITEYRAEMQAEFSDVVAQIRAARG